MLPVERGGFGLDAVWADDFHHALRRLCAGDHDGYFEDYQGTAGEVAQALSRGWIYEGARSHHRGGQPRGPSYWPPVSLFDSCIYHAFRTVIMPRSAAVSMKVKPVKPASAR